MKGAFFLCMEGAFLFANMVGAAMEGATEVTCHRTDMEAAE